jgi:uncharacterized protein YndB with AHSA1/START domain
MGKTIFTQQPEQKRILVEREFAGSLNNVWQAWTDPAILDQWWAPLPWMAVTKSMDFTEGGKWFYYMLGPAGEKHYCRADYKTIDPLNSFSGVDGFCDEEGNKNTAINSNDWHTSFSETMNGTKVTVVISFQSEADLKQMVEMGFVEGFTMAHDNLDALLLKINQLIK